MKIAYVKWLDSNGLSGRMSPKAAGELGPLPVESAGILVRDDGECVTLAQDYWRWTDSDGTVPETFRTIMVIPRVLVQRLEIIEVSAPGVLEGSRLAPPITANPPFKAESPPGRDDLVIDDADMAAVSIPRLDGWTSTNATK